MHQITIEGVLGDTLLPEGGLVPSPPMRPFVLAANISQEIIEDGHFLEGHDEHTAILGHWLDASAEDTKVVPIKYRVLERGSNTLPVVLDHPTTQVNKKRAPEEVAGDWRKVLDLFSREVDGYYDERYLWVRPSEENLQFIASEVGASDLMSMGCGSGLLEWLIQEATGVKVIGVEVDRGWWESSYSAPTFLPLRYADEPPPEPETIPAHGTALLFCYFNNGGAFREYVDAYQGDCVIIVGPGDGRGTRTNPEPFTAEFPDGWKLTAWQEVRETKDFVAVYRRSTATRESA